VSRWISVTVAASLIATLDGGFVYRWLSLAPSRVVRGEVWRLVTWPLVEQGALALVFTCLAIYKFGGELSIRWGDRRLRRFALQIAIVSGILTCALALLAGRSDLRRLGGWAMTDALLIGWARQFPDAPLMIYGLVSLRGRDLINLTLAVALVFAVFDGPVWMAPELCACFLAWRYPPGLSSR
jgi:hypothetical protein